MLLLLVFSIFASASLLFVVQPMIAKMLLPLVGGSPSVWNTSMVFFQAALLGGYLYAHLIGRLARRVQVGVHAAVLLLPLLTLPAALPGDRLPPIDTSPIPWLLGALLTSVGAPFFTLSTNGPLLQRWFANTAHPAAKDPYFLYAASNAGSMLALLGYPFWIEPAIGLADQRRFWTFGYAGFALLTLAASILLLKAPAKAPAKSAGDFAPFVAPAARVLFAKDRLRWLALAFVPSSLMLGVTQYLTLDLAAVPLLWVIPLAIYLFTFIVAFARRFPMPLSLVSRTLPMLALGVVLAAFMPGLRPIWVPGLVHLLCFFAAALLCHGRLAAERPDPAHLTEYYLLLAAGGVLGGIFNALIAPLVFPTLLEYPLMVVAACLLRLPGEDLRVLSKRTARILDFALPALPVAVFVAIQIFWKPPPIPEAGPKTMAQVVQIGLPGVLCLGFVRRRIRFALSLLALVSLVHLGIDRAYEVLHHRRTFFGIHRVTLDAGGRTRSLLHGTTLHGVQRTDAAASASPTSYYHPEGPIGEVLRFTKQRPEADRIGVVGLGAGALAAYARQDQKLTFYEIDPEVKRIAEDPRLFTFLSDARDRGVAIDVVLGDARLRLREAQPASFDLLILDAFSSDSVPMHLLSLEAVRLYLEKLAPGGLLLLHVTNNHVELRTPLAAVARDLGLVSYFREDREIPKELKKEGKDRSTCVILARSASDLGAIPRDPKDVRNPGERRWIRYHAGDRERAWTDDYSDLLSAFKWAWR